MENKIVSKDIWINARKEFLKKEKEFTKLRQQLASERRNLPWVRVDKDYTFESPEGKETLSSLFKDRSQLIVYHFMLGPGWKEGCKSCSFIGDHLKGPNTHLPHRDTTLLVISRAPIGEIQSFKKRMGWDFKWVSSNGNDFNFDFHVSFRPEEIESKKIYYNYSETAFPISEAPGVSVFFKNDAGEIFHTYSSFGRGLENFIGTYDYLDIAPRGRNEQGFVEHPMDWVRHHDRYL